MEVIITKTADEASALAADMMERQLMSKPSSVLGLATALPWALVRNWSSLFLNRMLNVVSDP